MKEEEKERGKTITTGEESLENGATGKSSRKLQSDRGSNFENVSKKREKNPTPGGN